MGEDKEGERERGKERQGRDREMESHIILDYDVELYISSFPKEVSLYNTLLNRVVYSMLIFQRERPIIRDNEVELHMLCLFSRESVLL